jgi:SAM-dependent methyltransferase
VIGCDLSQENLGTARRGNGGSQPLVRADAQLLPFADSSLDAVIMLEAIYFLPSARSFISEVRRVLRPGGWCILSSINKDCIDFNPHHSLYRELYGTCEIAALLRHHGFAPEGFGIIPLNQPSVRTKTFAPIKKLAISLNLIPEGNEPGFFSNELCSALYRGCRTISRASRRQMRSRYHFRSTFRT